MTGRCHGCIGRPDSTEAERVVGFVYFTPAKCAYETRLALASLYSLPTGWYEANTVAHELALRCGVRWKWARSMLHWAARSGALGWRHRGRRRALVHIDANRMRRAWPGFDPRTYPLATLDLEPLDDGPRPA